MARNHRTLLLPFALLAGVACGTSVTSLPANPAQGACVGTNLTGDPNTSSPPTCVTFSGYEWILKASPRFDPGPNAWSDQPANVFVNSEGLHLRITNRNGQWCSAEAILNQSLGFGTYEFHVSGIERLDRNVVLGLFTYEYANTVAGHREIDIEFSPLLGFSPAATGHFTVQPFQAPGNTHDFVVQANGVSTHTFEWRAERIIFTSGDDVWTYSGPGVPSPGGENVRVNLWLFGGVPPTDGAQQDVVIKTFQYRP